MSTPHRIIQVLALAIGGALAVIATSIILLGTQTVLHTTESLYVLLAGGNHPLDPAIVSATMDNELRFYAALGLSYGIALCWTARHIEQRARYASWLMGLFFLGGLGRALSYLAVGPPHPAFVVLMAVELAVPPVVFLCYARLRATQTGD